MTIDSTKYFCKRGATSARLNLVDTPLRGEYCYDGEHGKYYFGARYFDPFFGMWMSPDPAAVFFREVYAPLKWRDFIEKDILQRSNGEAVLLKHSFRASAQFANPYTYGGDPLNYVDPNGEAIIGAILSATSGIVKEAIKQKEDWWRVNRWDWGSIGNSAVAGAFIDLSGGPAGAAGTMLGFSFITRVADPDNKNRWGTIKDHFTGGAIIDWHGHFVGLNNAQYGGTVDWYGGNVVYSDGLAGAFMPDNSGAEFGGHALFVQNRYNKPVIAHEIRHVQQMEKRGNRFRYAVSYIDENGGTVSPNVPEYEYNPYENDARYAEFLYEEKKIDIYGNKKGNWTHKEVAPQFREWMWKRRGYNSFKSGGSNDNWQWKERWEYGNDF